jgi:hypothetical protein
MKTLTAPKKAIYSLAKEKVVFQQKKEEQIYHPLAHNLMLAFEHFCYGQFETFLRQTTATDQDYYWVCHLSLYGRSADNYITQECPKGKGFIALPLNYRLTKKERNQYPVSLERCTLGLQQDFKLLLNQLNKDLESGGRRT